MIPKKTNGQPDVEVGWSFLAHHNNVDEEWIILSIITQSIVIAPTKEPKNWIFIDNGPGFFRHLDKQSDCPNCKLIRNF